jgi:multiple sugar transport system permease protein
MGPATPVAREPASTRRSFWGRPGVRREIIGWLFAAPWVFGFLLFTAIPMGFAIWLIFQEWEIITPPKYVGLDNIKLAFTDPLVAKSLSVTGIWSLVTIPLHMVLGLAVALLMNQKLRGINLFRTIYYVPAVVPAVATGILWTWVFHPNYGVLNWIIRSLTGHQGPLWFADENWALPAMVIMSLWGVGGGMVMYLAGLQGIPTVLYEAATIDGAGRWAKFWHVTIPMLSPVLFFNLIMSIIGSFQVFDIAVVTTNGGPNNATLFYMLYLYRNAFNWYKMGYAATLAWILFFIALGLALLQFKVGEYWVFAGGVKLR